jgi:hypothetical protein
LIPLISLAETANDREGSVRANKENMNENDRCSLNNVDAAFAKYKTEKKPVLTVLRCVPCAGIDEKSLNKSRHSFRFSEKRPFVPLLLLLTRKKSFTL